GPRLVLHLMISGRLHWRDAGPGAVRKGRPTRRDLAEFVFSTGVLHLTEASTHQRASLHVVPDDEAVHVLDPGGIEPLDASAAAFRAALQRERHTLKRGLTDPRIFSGIGNAYSDEILHRARLSPLRLTTQLEEDELRRLHEATRVVLTEW